MAQKIEPLSASGDNDHPVSADFDFKKDRERRAGRCPTAVRRSLSNRRPRQTNLRPTALSIVPSLFSLVDAQQLGYPCMARVISVNVGQPAALVCPDRTVMSAIRKAPV